MRHGSKIDPPNRFERVHAERDDSHLEWDSEYLTQRENRRIEYIFDASKSIVAENQSPDVPFRCERSVNRILPEACVFASGVCAPAVERSRTVSLPCLKCKDLSNVNRPPRISTDTIARLRQMRPELILLPLPSQHEAQDSIA